MPPPVSLFTPTHDARWLADAHRSLVDQTWDDWEWVILPNGPAGHVPDTIRGDGRVVALDRPGGGPFGVGHLKRAAAARCRGDLLVELDHDDLLFPTALERLVAARGASGAGFFYSDFVEFGDDGTSRTYDPGWGWESYPATFRGAPYTATRAFAPDPASLHVIQYAPNHVRAWTRAAYDKAGGHDPALKLGDDHDLVCRTYLVGVDFHHVAEPLYMYRRHDANSHERDPEALDEARMAVSKKYTHPLVIEWCRRRGLAMIDLGPDPARSVGFIPADLEGGLRHLADDSVGCLRAVDCLGRLAPGTPIVDFWNEAYRVLAPGGWLVSMTPSTDGRGAWQDPFHRSGWNVNSFLCVVDPEARRHVPGLHARFQATRIYDIYPTEWQQRIGAPYVHADLVCLKGQRVAGESRF